MREPKILPPRPEKKASTSEEAGLKAPDFIEPDGADRIDISRDEQAPIEGPEGQISLKPLQPAGVKTASGDDPYMEASKAPLLAHLLELRSRLIKSLLGMLVVFFVALYFAEDIFQILARPYVIAHHQGEPVRMIYTDLLEKFIVDIKLALYAAFLVSFPLLAAQIWKFMAPGLYQHERRAFLPFLMATPVLFAAGALMAYFVVIPWAWAFFLSFEQAASVGGVEIAAEAKVNEYLSLIMQMIFAFGFAFLMPVALLLLARAGVLDAADLRAKRRYAVVVIFLLAAFLTPPDPFSQLALALPLLFLYELSIFFTAFSEKKNRETKQ